jgi:trigger factor
MFKKEKIKELHYSATGFLSAAEIQEKADEILLEYGKNAKMPGFRTGHVPLNVLRQKYNATAISEAVDKLMNKDLSDFVSNKKLRLAGAPKADIAKWEIGADMEYSLEFDILPTLPNIDLERYSVVKKIAKIEESEVAKYLDNLRKSRAVAEKQPSGYKAADGDIAVIDFKGFADNQPFEGGEAKNHHLVLGSGAFIPGFEDQIIGHAVGDKFNVNVKFPKEYHAKNLAGKAARFEVEIHELRRHKLPELNDEFAKAVKHESVEGLKDYIRKILAEQYQEAALHEMRSELLEILGDKIKLDLPETLVEQEMNLARREQEQGGHAGDHSHKWDEKKERKDAEHRVKLGLILADWGMANKMEITRDELQKAIWEEASRYSDPKQIFEFYNKNKDALSMLRGMLFERKVLDMMLSKVKVKEKTVSPKELIKQQAPK